MASCEEYFVLVHGHICGVSCEGSRACASAEAFLTRVSEVEVNPESLFDREEKEGIQYAHVLRAGARTLVEQQLLRQDCVDGHLIRAITRSWWAGRHGYQGLEECLYDFARTYFIKNS